MIEILPYGEQALLVNFEQKISLEIHQSVMHLYQKISQAEWEAIEYILPAYCSLTIGFDPFLLSFETLKDQISHLAVQPLSAPKEAGKNHRIPVCYEAKYAWDREEIEAHTQLGFPEIIELHQGTPYTVYMLGFLPGFPYMGSVSPQIACPRKQQPRLKIAAGSIGLAGSQTGIYPSEAPGGWQILGRTPLKVFDHRRPKPFLFRPGDQVNFYPISQEEFENWGEE